MNPGRELSGGDAAPTAQGVEWRVSQLSSGSRNGYVGRIPAFTLSWGIERGEGKPWVLRCTLPGFNASGRAWYVADEAEATSVAARVVAHFLRALGVAS